MTLTTGSGHKLYVSATVPATYDQAGYEAIAAGDWERTPCFETLPEVVVKYGEISAPCLPAGTTRTARGPAEPISFAPPIEDDPSNAGQQIIQTAFKATNGTSGEFISLKIENAAATQTVYAVASVLAFGTGARELVGLYLRVVEMSIDAATVVEVNV